MKKTLRILSLTALFSLTLAGCGEKNSSLPSASSSPLPSEPVSTPSSETPSSTTTKKASTAKAFYAAAKKAYDVTAKATYFSATQTLTSGSTALKGSATVRPEEEESEDASSSSTASTPTYDTYTFDFSTSAEDITTALAASGLKETDTSKYKASFTSSGKAGYSVKVDISSSQSEELTPTNFINDSLASSDYSIGVYLESGNLYFDFSDATIQKLLGKVLSIFMASSTPIDTSSYAYLMVSNVFASVGMVARMPTWDEIDESTRTSIDTFVDSFDDNTVLKSLVSFTSLDGVEEMKITLSKAVLAYLPAAIKAYALSELAAEYPDQTSDEYKSGEAKINKASTLLSSLANKTTVNKFVLTLGLSEDGLCYSTSDIDISVDDFSVNDTVDIPLIDLDENDNPTLSETESVKTYLNVAIDNFTFKNASSITYGYEDVVATKPDKTYLSLTSDENA